MPTQAFATSLRRVLWFLVFMLLAGTATAQTPSPNLDRVLEARSRQLTGRSRVVVQFRGSPDARVITGNGGIAGRALPSIGAQVAEFDNVELAAAARSPQVAWMGIDHPAFPTLDRTGSAIGAALARQEFGLTWIDGDVKPDIIAPGVGIESLSDPHSTLYSTYSDYLLDGTRRTSYKPYISMTGTSMAAPVVTGTVALMLEANPDLTPNAVKAILQYTAQVRDGEPWFAQGAGLLNTRGAVRMADFFEEPREGLDAPGDTIEGEWIAWAQHIFWGNNRMTGGLPLPGSNAWARGMQWGAQATAAGRPVVWGVRASDTIVWSTHRESDDTIVWSTNGRDTIVWSTYVDDDTIVWSTYSDDDTIVWSTDSRDTIVWSTYSDDTIVWSTYLDDDTIVWSTGGPTQMIWGAQPADKRRRMAGIN